MDFCNFFLNIDGPFSSFFDSFFKVLQGKFEIISDKIKG